MFDTCSPTKSPLIGPSDGSFMVGCDSCYKWYHGSCMNIDKAASETLTKWICPPCMGKGSTPPAHINGAKASATDKSFPVVELSTVIHNMSPHAPDPVKLWPPLGLRSSPHAVEALGKMGESDNEDFVKEARGSKSASRSSVYTVAQKKDNVALTSVRSGVGFKSGVSTATGQKTEKITAKSTLQKGAIKIPGQLRQAQPIMLPAAKSTAGNAAQKLVVPPTASNSALSMNMTKPSNASSSKILVAGTGPKIAARTFIPPTAATKSLAMQVKTPSIQKQVNSTASVNTVNKPAVGNVHVTGSKIEPLNGVSSIRQGTIKNSPPKQHVLPRDSIHTAVQNTTSKFIPGSTLKTSGASPKLAATSIPSIKVASLPQAATILTAGSPIKYPKPESGAVKVLSRGENASVTVKSTSDSTMPNQVCESKSTPTAPGPPGKETTTYPSKSPASCLLNGSTPPQSNSEVKPPSH